MIQRFQTDPDAEPRWYRKGGDLVWGDSAVPGVVFDPDSGETFFLNELPSLMLSTVTATPRSVEQLVERLAGTIAIDEVSKGKILAALIFLEDSELVESSLS